MSIIISNSIPKLFPLTTFSPFKTDLLKVWYFFLHDLCSIFQMLIIDIINYFKLIKKTKWNCVYSVSLAGALLIKYPFCRFLLKPCSVFRCSHTDGSGDRGKWTCSVLRCVWHRRKWKIDDYLVIVLFEPPL